MATPNPMQSTRFNVHEFIKGMHSAGLRLKRGRDTWRDVVLPIDALTPIATERDREAIMQIALDNYEQPPSYPREFAYRLAPWIAA